MTRKTTAFLLFAFALFVTSPANAYCILNKTADTLYASLADYHPLADFDVTLEPGKQVCCDWFDRRCNPTGGRGALVSIKIEGHKNRTKWKNHHFGRPSGPSHAKISVSSGTRGKRSAL